jgi:hypothetical protein
MWIIIRFELVNDAQSNQAVVSTDADLMYYINATIDIIKDGKIVMVPKESDHVNRKMFPIVTSDKCDFYAQWFEV